MEVRAFVFSFYCPSLQQSFIEHRLLSRKELFPFEVASMANLFPGSADEARSLIPTLHDKLEDVDIEEILNDMKAYESKYVFETKWSFRFGEFSREYFLR